MIEHAIVVMNGKGGVGKTSLTANLGGLAAHSGWRVLLIDIDQQGNLARDLGVLDASDAGMNLRAAIAGTAPLTPIPARANLDLVPGGKHLEPLTSDINTTIGQGRYLTALAMLERAITPIASGYDLIVIDTPPGERAVQTLAAHAAHHVVVPTAPDDCSIDGLATVFDRVQHLRTEGANPHLDILSVAITLTVSNARAVQRRLRHTLFDLLAGDVPVFFNSIRFAQAAATDCRRRGLLEHEYETAAHQAGGWWTQPDGERYSTAAAGLADEILGAHNTRVGLLRDVRKPA
jgi:chromosome partitioning protein